MSENSIPILEMVTEYAKSINANDAKDLLIATIMPLVCTVIDDLIEEGKLKLC